MTSGPDRAECDGDRPWLPPAEDLNRQARVVLRHAVYGHRNGLKVYESLRNLNEVIGTEYGDRVLYELIQNAHDAHRADDRGRIAVRLAVRSDTDGTLYVANGGSGFREEDLDAIKNLATTAKEVGEGIGNKGLGFRSIEALTDDVGVFSRRGRSESARFDGYCFRFATVEEIERLLRRDRIDAATARDVARTVPRYLVPVPLAEQPDDVVSYARRGYASVIVVPLRAPEAIELAKRQVGALADFDVPLLLFLSRIAEFRIDVETPGGPVHRRRLSRRQTDMGDVPGIKGCHLHEVHVGEDRRFLVVQREVEKPRVLDAVRRSVSRAPQLNRWLDWKGQPTVSIAVGLSRGAVTGGHLYNFLPMGGDAVAPLVGHLDAPFFAEIDRRNADFDLPLNAALMEAAAEACAHAALHIAGQADTSIPQRAVFDLVAWTGRHAGKLDAALDGMGRSLGDAPVVPTIAVDGTRWASLSAVSVWPAGAFSLMKATEVARRTGARLVSGELDGDRLDRLGAMAKRKYLHLAPSGRQLAEWSERFARSLADRNAAARTWSRFYEDLKRVFGSAREKLDALAGRAVILDRAKKLRPAGGHDPAAGTGVFVRSETSRRRRAKDGVPLPPATLSRRYRFLDEKIAFRHDTLNAFIEADLVRHYDPAEALAWLGSALGAKANDNRRREALTWAFSVWRTASVGIQNALRSARLRVPTASGWRLATQAAFSSSWTAVGLTLENFLVEASDTSPDCRRARDALLVDFADWPAGRGGTRRQWVDFLSVLGVADGLRPVAGRIQESDWGFKWDRLVRDGDAKEALERDWCNEASLASFRYPNTVYRRRGAASRLPGQIEHAELPEAAKEAFQELAFRHLEAHNGECLTFEIGRFERAQRDWNRQTLPTPLATFLRSKAWIAAGTNEEPGFRKASDCWASRTRQDRPPRFMERVPDAVAGLVEGSQELAELVFGGTLGLRDWHAANTAPERLRALVAVASALPTHDRRDFRKEYRRAWHDLSETDAGLPGDLDLAVNRDGRLETLGGDAEISPTVIVTQSAEAFEARILLFSGHAVLDIGEASVRKVARRLAATGRFRPRQLDGIGVQLLVDGESFVPRTSDPLLVSLGLGWLPEVVLLGHEILAEGLELGVQRVRIERRIRAIRVRRCQTITLVVDEKNASPGDSMPWYAFEHSELPTLILSDRVPLARRTLGRDLSRTVARLIDTRLRFLSPEAGRRVGTPSRERLAGRLGPGASRLRSRGPAGHPRRFREGHERAGGAHPRVLRRRRRSVLFDQDRAGRFRFPVPGRRQRPQPPLRSPRARDGGRGKRNRLPRRVPHLRFHVLLFCRLHAPLRAAGGDFRVAGGLRLDPRLGGGRGRRPHPPARGAPHVAPRHAEPPRGAARRRQRDGGGVAARASPHRGPHGAGPHPAEGAGPGHPRTGRRAPARRLRPPGTGFRPAGGGDRHRFRGFSRGGRRRAARFRRSRGPGCLPPVLGTLRGPGGWLSRGSASGRSSASRGGGGRYARLGAVRRERPRRRRGPLRRLRPRRRAGSPPRVDGRSGLRRGAFGGRTIEGTPVFRPAPRPVRAAKPRSAHLVRLALAFSPRTSPEGLGGRRSSLRPVAGLVSASGGWYPRCESGPRRRSRHVRQSDREHAKGSATACRHRRNDGRSQVPCEFIRRNNQAGPCLLNLASGRRVETHEVHIAARQRLVAYQRQSFSSKSFRNGGSSSRSSPAARASRATSAQPARGVRTALTVSFPGSARSSTSLVRLASSSRALGMRSPREFPMRTILARTAIGTL